MPPVEETVGAMAQLVKEGKVRYIGLWEAAKAGRRGSSDCRIANRVLAIEPGPRG